SSQMHPNMMLIESISEIFKKSDYFLNNFSRDEGFVSADRGGHYYVVQNPHTCHIVNIHHKRILRDPSPDGCVSGFLIPQIRQTGFGTGRVGVHDVTEAVISYYIIG